MQSINQIFLWLSLFCITYTYSEELPEYLKICHKSDPNLTSCMQRSIETLRPYLTAGIPELDIPSLEPIELGDLIVAESVPGQGLSITVKDIRAFGASQFLLKKLSVNEYGKTYTVDIELPNLHVDGKYYIDGRILVIPVKGGGKLTGDFTGGAGVAKVRIETNSKGFVSVKKIDIKIKVKNGSVKLDNLFGSDTVLGEVVNQTINQNFDILSKEIIPLIEKSLNRIFKRIGNKIVERFTAEQLFPV